MDAKHKDKIRDVVLKTSVFFSKTVQTIASVLRMLLLSSLKVSIKSSKYNKLKENPFCTILANGPSLKNALENSEVRLDNSDLFCVNNFCDSQYFTQLKPKYYCIIDGEFFNNTHSAYSNQVKRLKDALRAVDWNMYLVVPSFIKGGEFKTIVDGNKHIQFLHFNTTSVNGFSGFCNWVYKKHLGMPSCINVSIFAIMAALNMEYRSIYLYGVDHTFTSQLFVDDDNVVCSAERHVYNTTPSIDRMPYTTMSRILMNIATGFAVHEQVEKYSRIVGCKIMNCTKGSFIDSYERFKYDN